MCFAIPLRHICWTRAQICMLLRNCWVIRVWPPPRYIHITVWGSSRLYIIRHIPGIENLDQMKIRIEDSQSGCIGIIDSDIEVETWSRRSWLSDVWVPCGNSQKNVYLCRPD